LSSEKDDAGSEVGPVYGVDLIKTLPLGSGGMLQAMPSCDDLNNVVESGVGGCGRVVAGYEVLLSHYHRLVKEVAESRAVEKGGE
jgi:hypothetical protein